MVDRLRQSLALRLAALYTAVFALTSGLLFGFLYWELSSVLEAREHAAVEQLARRLGAAYEEGGSAGVRAEIDSNASPEVRSFFVRVVGPSGQTLFASVPPDWVQTSVQSVPLPDGWGLSATREIHTVRVPRDALRDYAVATAPLGGGGAVQVGRSTDSRAVLLAPLKKAFALVGAFALILSAAVGTVLAWRATRPLRLVSDTARRILETGDLDARVPTPGGSDELALLVGQLNTLLTRNAAHVRVLRETLDGLAHDLRTPLTRLRGTAETALHEEQGPAQARGALAECIEETDRLLHVIETLLDVSAAEGGALRLHRSAVDLRSLAARAVDLYREVAEEKQIVVELEGSAAEEVDGDAVRLGQVVNNLLDNALKYTPAGGRIVLATSGSPKEAVLSVADTGPGVPQAERDAVFRRLYRGDTSRSQRGLGLGLSLAKAIVESHQGAISIGEAPEGGARFVVRLPRAAPAL